MCFSHKVTIFWMDLLLIPCTYGYCSVDHKMFLGPTTFRVIAMTQNVTSDALLVISGNSGCSVYFTLSLHRKLSDGMECIDKHSLRSQLSHVCASGNCTKIEIGLSCSERSVLSSMFSSTYSLIKCIEFANGK